MFRDPTTAHSLLTLLCLGNLAALAAAGWGAAHLRDKHPGFIPLLLTCAILLVLIGVLTPFVVG